MYSRDDHIHELAAAVQNKFLTPMERASALMFYPDDAAGVYTKYTLHQRDVNLVEFL